MHSISKSLQIVGMRAALALNDSSVTRHLLFTFAAAITNGSATGRGKTGGQGQVLNLENLPFIPAFNQIFRPRRVCFNLGINVTTFYPVVIKSSRQ